MKTYNNYKGMKSIARLISLVLLLCMAIGNAWGATIPFSETFNSCNGTGGNDGTWSGNIATSSPTYDNSGWNVYTTNCGGDKCIKQGSGSKKGYATTPSITVVNGNSYQLVFKAAPFDSESTGMTVTITGGTISGETTASTATMETSEWNEYSYTIVANSTSLTVRFEASSKNRFFLDDVQIKSAIACTAAPTVTAGSNSAVTSTTATISCTGGLSSLGTGGCSITSYGFVIGPNANPELSGDGTTTYEVGTSYSTTGTPFSKDLTDLTPNTTYYVRPYATNGFGTGYGTQTSFTTLQRYAITYNNNGGSNSIANAYKDHGVAFTLPNNAGNMTKTGYHIADWKLNSATGTSYALGGSYTGNEAAEFYAGWVANSYTVQFNKNNSSASGSMSNQAFTYDEAQNLTECGFTIAASTHKYFAGWATTTQKATAGTVDYADGASVSNITGTNNGTVTLYAVWKDHTYTNYRTTCCTKYAITKAAVTDGTLVIEDGKAEACEGEEITLTATPDEDYVGGTITVIKTGSNPEEDVTETYYNAGTGKLTMPAFGVTISATFAEPSSPLLVVSGEALDENTLTFGEQGKDQASAGRSFTVTGSNLAADVTWALSGADASMFAVTPASPLSQSAVSAGQEITVTFTPTSIGEKSATLTFSSTGAPDKAIALTGTGKWVVSWVANDGEPAFATTLCADGETPTLPDGTPTSCDGTSTAFAGWTQTKWIGKLSQEEVDARTGAETVYTSAVGMPAVTANTTYHAVFAVRTQTGVEAVKAQTLQYDTWTYSGSTTDKGTQSPKYRLFHEDSYIESAAFDLSTLNKVKIYGGYFGNSNCLTMTIDDGTNTWKNVTLESSNNQSNENEFTEGAALSGTGKLYIRSTCGSTDGNGSGIRLTKVEIYVNSPVYSYSDYMTTCRDDVHAITIADGIEGGTVNAAKWGLEEESVTLTATPNDGYNFGSWNVTKTGDAGTVITVENNAFTMPAYDVTVSATFAPKPMTALTLSESALLGEVGNDATLTVSSYEPADLLESQKTVNWTSDNASIASVENGVVSYNAPGTATITAAWTQDADVKATCAVTVYQWNLAGADTYEVTAAPETSYTDIAHFDKSAVTIKANYVRSDDPAITKQVEVATENWTAKLNGTEIADNYSFFIEDNGKTLALYVGETLVWSEAITVVEETKDRFVDNLWGNATIFRTGTDYTLPVLENQTAGDAATCKDHNIFMGWVLAANADDLKDENIIAAGTNTTAANNTYYAVWAKQVTGPREFSIKYDWEGTSAGWTVNSITDGGDYGKTSGGNIVTTTTYASPKSISAKLSKSSGNTSSSFSFEYGNSSWDNIATISFGDITKDEWGNYSYNLTDSKYQNKKFRISMSGSAQYGLIDEVILVYEQEDTYNTDYITDCETRYEISFNANGGTGSYESVLKKAGKTVVLPDGSELGKEHHDFIGWRADNTGELLNGGSEYTVGTANVAFYAQWSEWSKATVTFKNGEETVGTPAVVYRGENYTTPAAPVAAEGKLFQGWSDGVNTYDAGIEVAMANPAVAVTYNALWKDILPTPDAPAITTADLANGEWVLVTANSQIKEGDVVIVTSKNATSGKYFAMSTTQEDKYRGSVDAIITGNKLNATDNMAKLFVQVGYGDNQYALYAINDQVGYLYYPGSNNELKTQTDLTKAASWNITINDDYTATIQNTSYTNYEMKYNPTNPRFTCYTSGQNDVVLYKWVKKISDDTNLSDVTLTDAVIVKNGATLTVDAASSLVDLTVEAGGKVETTNELTVINNLLIKTSLGTISGDETNTNGKCGEITNGNNIVANGDVFIEIELTQEAVASSGWYAFSVPFPVDAMNGVYYGNTKLTNEVGYAIMSYHGDVRAQGLYGWKKYRGIMQPGTLYIIAVGDTDYKTLRFKKVAGENIVASNEVSVMEYASETGNDQDGGWNGIGNPNLQVSNYSATSVMQFLDHSNNCFRPRASSDINLMVGSAFMMQIQTTTTITIVVGNSGSIALAPSRDRNVEKNTLYELKLRNTETNVVEDNLFFSASEEANNTYEIGRDVAKFSMGDAKCAQMYVPAYGTQLCAADFPLVNNQAIYPLTITAPAAGNYRIDVAKEYENANIYLMHEGMILWDLTTSGYEIDLPQGTTEGYSIVLQANAPQIATGVDEVEANSSAQKVIINDHVYILRGGKMFDVTGKRTK